MQLSVLQEGSWRLDLPEPGEKVAVAVNVVHPTFGEFFSASFTVCDGECSWLACGCVSDLLLLSAQHAGATKRSL